MIFPYELMEDAAVKGDHSTEILLICGTRTCVYYKVKVFPVTGPVWPKGWVQV